MASSVVVYNVIKIIYKVNDVIQIIQNARGYTVRNVLFCVCHVCFFLLHHLSRTRALCLHFEIFTLSLGDAQRFFENYVFFSRFLAYDACHKSFFVYTWSYVSLCTLYLFVSFQHVDVCTWPFLFSTAIIIYFQKLLSHVYCFVFFDKSINLWTQRLISHFSKLK